MSVLLFLLRALPVVVGLDHQEQDERNGDETDRGIDDETNADAGLADVESVQALDRSLSAVFAIIAAVTLCGPARTKIGSVRMFTPFGSETSIQRSMLSSATR